jgi:rhodanese-related sulfurtransferase
MSKSRLKTLKQMVAEASERIQGLSAQQVATEIEGEDALLVDLREDDEFVRRIQHEQDEAIAALPLTRAQLRSSCTALSVGR